MILSKMMAIRHNRKFIFGSMLISACFSLVAAFVLSVDAIRIAEDANTVLSCDLNTIISCGTVARTWQANLLGFPNAFFGLIAESVVITVAVAGMGGVKFPRWFMASAQFVYTLGLIFAYWLFYESYFHIGALCPWCLVITISTTVVFSSLTHINVIEDNLFLPSKVRAWAKNIIANDIDIIALITWFVLLTAVVLLKYGSSIFA